MEKLLVAGKLPNFLVLDSGIGTGCLLLHYMVKHDVQIITVPIESLESDYNFNVQTKALTLDLENLMLEKSFLLKCVEPLNEIFINDRKCNPNYINGGKSKYKKKQY